jgi:hypothetical protein
VEASEPISDAIVKITDKYGEPPASVLEAAQDDARELLEARKAELWEDWWSGYVAGWQACQQQIRDELLEFYAGL